MKPVLVCLAALTFSMTYAVAQDAATPPAEDMACAELTGTAGATAEEIASLNDVSVVTVVRCRADGEVSGDNVTALRSAVAANTSLAPAFEAAGAQADQVVAVQRGADNRFSIFVIGAYR